VDAAAAHEPVLLAETLELLDVKPGGFYVDGTLGLGGHAAALLARSAPDGRLLGVDRDAETLAVAAERLQAFGARARLVHADFRELPQLMGESRADGLLLDLGVSSLQLDTPERGFSFRADGPLDMRMDRTRGRTAAQLLQTIPEAELTAALRELGDEPDADRVAAAVVAARARGPLATTRALAEVVAAAVPGGPRAGAWRVHPAPGRWQTHPAARTFQALRILINRELANLAALLRQLPDLLRPGAVAAVITFHSGEDRLVKASLRAGLRAGRFRDVSGHPARPSWQERLDNPRARSAKLRWARRA